MREEKEKQYFTPLVQYLTDADLEKLDMSREREARRRRRLGRGRKEIAIISSPPKSNLTPLTYRGTLHRAPAGEELASAKKSRRSGVPSNSTGSQSSMAFNSSKCPKCGTVLQTGNQCKTCLQNSTVSKPESTLTSSQLGLIPPWLLAAKQELDERYPHDHFDFVLVNGKEVKMKCVDCGPKILAPGPGRTLSNFEAHLKQKIHRTNVERKLNLNKPQT